MTTDMIKTFIHAFITSNLDYCNILYYNLRTSTINNLQKIQNTAARLITGKMKHDHITPILKELHWLPIHKRIENNIDTNI